MIRRSGSKASYDSQGSYYPLLWIVYCFVVMEGFVLSLLDALSCIKRSMICCSSAAVRDAVGCCVNATLRNSLKCSLKKR